MKDFKRKTIFNVTKVQKSFFYPVIVAFFIGCAISWLSLAYTLINDYFFDPNFFAFRRAIPWLLVFLSVSMVALVFWTFSLSNRILGPYERIVRELDEVLEGNRKHPLAVRKGDMIFEELLKRVNVLIQRMQG